MTAHEIHILTRKITFDLFNELGIIATIGIYASNDDKKHADIKKDVMNIVKEYDDVKQIHGLYIDDEKKDIYFDIIIDFKCENQEKLRDEIIKNLSKKYTNYEFNIILDDDISD